MIPHAAVLQAPDREPFTAKCVAEGPGVSDVVARSPAAAVEDDGDGMGPRPSRESKLSELKRVGAVVNSSIGLGMSEAQNLLHAENGSARREVESSEGVVVEAMAAFEALRVEPDPRAASVTRTAPPDAPR